MVTSPRIDPTQVGPSFWGTFSQRWQVDCHSPPRRHCLGEIPPWQKTVHTVALRGRAYTTVRDNFLSARRVVPFLFWQPVSIPFSARYLSAFFEIFWIGKYSPLRPLFSLPVPVAFNTHGDSEGPIPSGESARCRYLLLSVQKQGWILSAVLRLVFGI
jgi:hypothetical protein